MSLLPGTAAIHCDFWQNHYNEKRRNMGPYGKFDIGREHCSTTVVASLMALYLKVEALPKMYTPLLLRVNREARLQINKWDDKTLLKSRMRFKNYRRKCILNTKFTAKFHIALFTARPNIWPGCKCNGQILACPQRPVSWNHPLILLPFLHILSF